MRKLTCKEVILECLSDYLDATLNPDIAEDLEGHLATCKPCVAYLNTYKRTRELTGQTALLAMPEEMPEEMKAHLRQFLLQQLAKG